MCYSSRNLTELPPMLNTLTSLDCSNNRLTLLPEQLPKSLEVLDCYNNRLTRLPEHLPNSLKYLYCDNNRLTKLFKNLPKILVYNCSDNPFLFNLKNNLIRIWYTPEWNNYKVLVILQSKIQSENKLQKFMNRDISRLCSRY